MPPRQLTANISYTIAIALFSSACATMDSDAERVETTVPATGYGVFDSSRYQVNQTQTYVPNAIPTAGAPMAPPAPIPSTNGPSRAPSSDPGVYAGDSGFSPWPGTPTGATGIEATCSTGNASNAQQVVGSMGPGFRRCYNRALQADQSIAGSIRIMARISPDGHVTSATPINVIGLPAAVITCVTEVVQNNVFSPPCGGGATLVIPVSFVSK